MIREWTDGVPVEDAARKQLEQTASMPFVSPHLAVMPDVHLGMGSTIGSVIPTEGAVMPAAVGVDIGCGMSAVKTGFVASDLPDSLLALRTSIEAAIPHGRSDNGGANDKGSFQCDMHWPDALKAMYARIIRDDPWLDRAKHPARQCGTLGGGNHFIEICLDKEDNVWVMLHSGSRGVGNRIGSYFTRQAKKACEDVELPSKDLAYLQEGTPGFDRYMYAVDFAQNYAWTSRQRMMAQVLWCLDSHMTRGRCRVQAQAIDCHHNYVQREEHFGKDVWITRKGAVSARTGQLGIIPGSMGERSFIVRGKGNADSFHSCSHGAGRVMSRTRARKEITLEEHRIAVKGVESRIDESILDESPRAYKDIDAVMAAQDDLVEIVTVLNQVVCVKG